MAIFAMVQMGNTPGCFINLDQVRVMTPATGGTSIAFDDGHRIGVATPIAAILSQLNKDTRKKSCGVCAIIPG